MKPFPADVDGIEVRCLPIGALEQEYGTDQYILLKRLDTPITQEQAERLMAHLYEREPSQPGGLFCHHTRVLPDGNSWVGIAQVRYDV